MSMSRFNLQPIKPTAHRRMQQDYDQRSFELHKERLKTAKSSVDTLPPKIYPHLEVKMKRLQLESDRLRQIEHENRRLLKILVQTAEKPTGTYTLNDDSFRTTNQQKRIKQSLRIVGENERIVNRLVNVKGSYNKNSLNKNFLDHETRLKTISQYNHPWRFNRNADFANEEILKVNSLTPLRRKGGFSRSSSFTNSVQFRGRSRSSDDSTSLPPLMSRRCSGSVVSDEARPRQISNDAHQHDRTTRDGVDDVDSVEK